MGAPSTETSTIRQCYYIATQSTLTVVVSTALLLTKPTSTLHARQMKLRWLETVAMEIRFGYVNWAESLNLRHIRSSFPQGIMVALALHKWGPLYVSNAGRNDGNDGGHLVIGIDRRDA